MKRNINNPSSQQYNFENFTSLSCDMITKLVNRTCFMELFKNLTSQADTSNQTGVFLLINVDEFRSINDIYGHSVGDELLHRLAVLIQDTVINFDLIKYYTSSASIVGYLGSDEFGVFLPERNKEEGIRLAEEIRQKIEKTHFAGIPISSTVSIGIGIYPEHGSSTSELLTKTDAALYRAKEKKGNCCHLYLSEDRVLEQMHSRLEWKDRIKNALEEDRISPWFQPILSLKDNQIHHYEALARMEDENGEILLPTTFIFMAERFNLVDSIDRVITKKTMEFQAKLSKEGSDLTFGMNLSGKDLESRELLSYLQSALASTGADPSRLIFEITETAAVYNLDAAIKFIRELQSLGCRFSLDDFGVGFTSFIYLREMKVDFIKIDGSFIKQLHENSYDQLFVKAMVDVAKGMGIKTIAEFVETEETMKILKNLDVDYIQGFLIGKAEPQIQQPAIKIR